MNPLSILGHFLALSLTPFQRYQHLQKCPEENTLFNLPNRASLSVSLSHMHLNTSTSILSLPITSCSLSFCPHAKHRLLLAPSSKKKRSFFYKDNMVYQTSSYKQKNGQALSIPQILTLKRTSVIALLLQECKIVDHNMLQNDYINTEEKR